MSIEQMKGLIVMYQWMHRIGGCACLLFIVADCVLAYRIGILDSYIKAAKEWIRRMAVEDVSTLVRWKKKKIYTGSDYGIEPGNKHS